MLPLPQCVVLEDLGTTNPQVRGLVFHVLVSKTGLVDIAWKIKFSFLPTWSHLPRPGFFPILSQHL